MKIISVLEQDDLFFPIHDSDFGTYQKCYRQFHTHFGFNLSTQLNNFKNLNNKITHYNFDVLREINFI